MTYEYRCPCGEIGIVQHGVKDTVFVSHCFGQVATRHFSPDAVPYHTEDRRHMRGEKMSHATGKPYAQSRREERVIEKAGGFEFVGKSDMPAQWKTLRDHFNYTKQGGEPLSPNVLNPPPNPKVEPGTILRKMSEKGLRFGSR